MVRFILKIILVIALLWVVAPLSLSETILVRASSSLALIWFTLALLLTALLVPLITYHASGETRLRRRYWLLFGTSLLICWFLLPLLIPESTQRYPPILIVSLQPLGLAWGISALIGSILVLALCGRQARTANDAARQRTMILQIMGEQLVEGIAVYRSRMQLRWINAAGSRYLHEGKQLRPEILRLIERAQGTRRVATQSMILSETERVMIQVQPLPDGSTSVIARPVQNEDVPGYLYDRFIRRIVHDMRNPLAAIIAHANNLNMLEDGRGEAANWKNTIQIIETEAQRLTRLVDSMLFDARLAYVPLAFEQLDLIDVIEEVYFQHDERALREGKLVEVEMPQTTAPLEADRDLLVRALSNLVDNSLKYAVRGAVVRINLEIEAESYIVRVSDTGDGIPPEYLPERIFEPLVRVRSRDGGGGSGLGLSIVKKIVEMHHGSIGVESAIGRGTTITICLPRS